MYKKVIAIVCVVLLAVVAFYGGYSLSTYEYEAFMQSSDSVVLNRADYEKLARFSRLSQILDMADTYFYSEYDAQEASDYAAKGMLYALKDPYAYYFTPKEAQELYADESGNYVGIGVQMLLDGDYVVVTTVFKGSPAEAAGIMPGDRFIAVNGQSILGLSTDELADMVRGEANTDVTVAFLRGDEEVEFTITRKEIVYTYVEYKMIDEIGDIRIDSFVGDVVDAFEEAVAYVESQNARGLILDVRYNGGGYLLDVEAIADMLLPEGLIYYTEGKNSPRYEASSDGKHLGLPMAILVNGYSASASEILAGALQDSGTADVVGEQTFGKGIVQTQIPFKDGAMVKFTTAYYYTPSGRCIHGEGITPDYVVSAQDVSTYNIYTADEESDVQLLKAIEVVKEKIK